MPTGIVLSPAAKALTAQIAGWGVVLAIGYSLPSPAFIAFTPWTVAAIQAVAAAGAALLLRSAPWWPPIHLLFMPLIVAAQTLSLHPLWYLAAFLLLTLTYWSSFRTQAPLFLSSHAAVRAVAALIADQPRPRLLDIGSGIGSLLVPLAVLRPDCHFTGIENAPGPLWLSRRRGRSLPNVRIVGGDFFALSWSPYDLVYAFLSPVPMATVWRKARDEMRPGALLVSNSFPVPDIDADQVIDLEDGKRLFLYQF